MVKGAEEVFLGIAWVGLVLHAAVRARAGVLYQYPFVLRFLK